VPQTRKRALQILGRVRKHGQPANSTQIPRRL